MSWARERTLGCTALEAEAEALNTGRGVAGDEPCPLALRADAASKTRCRKLAGVARRWRGGGAAPRHRRGARPLSTRSGEAGPREAAAEEGTRAVRWGVTPS